jgi:hypothetical protein
MSGILNIGNIQANTAGAATTFVPITASGGFRNQVIAANGVQYMCHVFTQSGTWTVNATGSSNEVDYLVVGGGGGGGMIGDRGASFWANAGGAGGGAYLSKTYTPSQLSAGTTITLIVGAGGNPGPSTQSIYGGTGANGKAIISWT